MLEDASCNYQEGVSCFWAFLRADGVDAPRTKTSGEGSSTGPDAPAARHLGDGTSGAGGGAPPALIRRLGRIGATIFPPLIERRAVFEVAFVDDAV